VVGVETVELKPVGSGDLLALSSVWSSRFISGLCAGFFWHPRLVKVTNDHSKIFQIPIIGFEIDSESGLPFLRCRGTYRSRHQISGAGGMIESGKLFLFLGCPLTTCENAPWRHVGRGDRSGGYQPRG